MILREICNNNTAVELKEIAKNNGLSGYSKMKKAELVELVSGHLMNYDTIEETLLLADERELSCFEQICKGEINSLPEAADEYVFFFMRGYLSINEKREVSVADDVKRLFPVVYNSEFQTRRAQFQALLDYCKAGVNLYGIVPVGYIVEYYNSCNRAKTTREELLDVLKKAQTRNCYVELKGEDLVHELLTTNENAYQTLVDRQEGKPFYCPERVMFLNYANEQFIDQDEHYKKYLSFFTDFMYMTADMAESVVNEVECLYGQGMDAQDILKELEKQGLTYKDEFQKKQCLTCTMTYTNHIRLWENRGNTKAALGLATNASNVLSFVPSTEPIKRTEKKVGRNDPCPCGSGKKYKHCCGR